jgi:tripartite-type tricarboxylate transporter receptor subunit TctC
VDEAGLAGFHISSWQALFAPKGTTQAVVARLNASIIETLADPAVRRSLADLGQQVFPPGQLTPSALAEMQAEEIKRWWPIIRAANIKSE